MIPGSFTFSSIEKIIYGQPAAQALLTEVERLKAKKVFLIVSGTMNRSTDEVLKVTELLGPLFSGLYDRMPSHTPREAVLESSALARRAQTDLIVSFGGGSVTDAGKLMQICLRHNIQTSEELDQYRTRVESDGKVFSPSFEGPLIRQIAIPTTLSGGEFQAQGGCTDTQSKMKHSFRHPLIVPKITILDPLPTLHTPMWVWLSTGVRAIDHAIEGLCYPNDNPVSDAHFIKALNLLSQALPQVFNDPKDMKARLDCQLGVMLAMKGREGGAQMGASHSIGHVLGGSFGVAHGFTSCVMLPAVLQFNRDVNHERQKKVAKAMGYPGQEASEVVASLIARLGLPKTLTEVGINEDQYDMIAHKAMHGSWLHTNPKKINSPNDVLKILHFAS